MTVDEVTVAIPTYERGEILLPTLAALLAQAKPPILVVDQTLRHEAAIQARLEALAHSGAIRWVRMAQPSIPAAMNAALLRSERPVVLFLDDDIVPGDGLVAAHASSYGSAGEAPAAVVGQVLQPGEEPDVGPHAYTRTGLRAFLDFPFNSTEPAWVANVMAGNLSVRREQALGVGGFDENFVGAAFRFETEFCRRLIARGGRIFFQPRASLRHLRAPRGGTRILGSHQASASPLHGVGDYYFALREPLGAATLSYVARRPLREVCTRFHLRHPWWIPAKLLGELRAFGWACRLRASGPRYAPASSSPTPAVTP